MPEMAEMEAEVDEGVVLVDRPPSAQWSDPASNNGRSGFDGARRYQSQAEAVDADALEAQLDDVALGEDIDQGVAAELGATPQPDPDAEDLPFDPDEARAFDAAVPNISGFAETDLPQPTDTIAYQDLQEPDGLAVAGGYDPYAAEEPQPQLHGDPTAMNADVREAAARAESLVEDDVDEADFYAGQGMFPEAMDTLRVLLARHPNHPLILTKMREVQALESGEHLEGQPVDTPPAGQSVPIEVTPDHTGGTEALDLDEIEELDDVEEIAAEDFEEEVAEEAQPAAAKRKPSVMLEHAVDEGDAETHYDLGLAYKEMGLFDEAIKAFEKVLRAPGREVQCRVMLGMCQREQGNPQEAIHQFKQGLHANPSERERLSLYYEIGITYESVGDEGEALYYFEAVTKREPGFADAAQRADALRASVGEATPPPDDLDL